MKELVKSNKLLLLLLSIYLITGVFILLHFSKGEFELLINKRHQVYFDYFFYYITYLGDGWGSAFIILLMFLRRIYYGILALISLVTSTVIVQVLKRNFFYDFPRPAKFFVDKVDLHVIDGLELHTFYSFPSGHSSGAFAVFITLCLVSKNQAWVLFYFILSILVTISRVYLLQHFFIDTFFGAFIGSFCAWMVFYYYQYKSNFYQLELLQKPLLKVFYKK